MQKNYNENLVAGAAIRDDKGRRISKLFEASHPKMTVGYAKNLIMPDTPTEQEFNFRQSGGGVIEDGVAVIDKVKGNSVVWNQQNNNSDARTKTYNGITYTFNSNKTKCTITGTSTARSNIAIKSGFSVVKGRKYFVGGIPSVASASTCRLCINEGNEPQGYIRSNFFIASSIYTVPSGTTKLTLEIVGAEVANYSPSSVVFQPVLIDLTQMFGAGNEPATVEEFLSRKPKVADEYAYNEGTIVNNKVEKVVTTGRNLWDEEWEVGRISSSDGTNISGTDSIRSKNYIPVDSGYTYYVFCKAMADAHQWLRVRFYDANKNYVGYANQQTNNGQMTFTAEVKYIRFFTYEGYYGSTYNHDICINLSDPAINDQYFPYEKHELDLSWVKDIKDAEGNLLFPDGLRSVGIAYDEVTPQKAIRHTSYVDLGSFSWYKGELSNNRDVFYTEIDALLKIGAKYDPDIAANVNTSLNLTPIQQAATNWPVNSIIFNVVAATIPHGLSIGIVLPGGQYATADDFRTAMQGQPMLYELAEPIEVEYDEKNLTYPVVAGGTEEAIASEPSTAFRADIGYGIDAVKTILDLKARVEALEGK